MTNQNLKKYIYIFRPDNIDEFDTEYFSSAPNAISYGIHHSDKTFSIEKRLLYDRNPNWSPENTSNNIMKYIDIELSRYSFTQKGDITYNYSYEYKLPFEENDTSRFEDMFLRIKSSFACGDIVMGADFEEPRVVYTDHDCYEELYDQREGTSGLGTNDNFIRVDWIGKDGNSYYEHVSPFDLWKIDSWNDKIYCQILQIVIKAVKNEVQLTDLRFLIYDYMRENKNKREQLEKE